MKQETDASMYTFLEDFCIFKYLNYIFIVHKGGLYILINVHLYFEHTQVHIWHEPIFPGTMTLFFFSSDCFFIPYTFRPASILALLLKYENNKKSVI